MQIKQRIKKLEKTSFDVSQMSDEKLKAISERDRAKYPNRYKQLDEVFDSLSDKEIEHLGNGNIKLVSTETLLRLNEAYKIQG